jgi:glycopeptide antibiotics resistance protein
MALNVLGFVSLGFLIAWARWRVGLVRAVVAGFAISLGMEVAQVWIPGR